MAPILAFAVLLSVIQSGRGDHHEQVPLGPAVSNFFNVAPQQAPAPPPPPPPPPPQAFQPPPPRQPPPPQAFQPPPQAFQPPPQAFQPPPQAFQPPPTPSPTPFQPPPAPQPAVAAPAMLPQLLAPAPAPSAPSRNLPCQPGEVRIGNGDLTSQFKNTVYYMSWSDRGNAQKSWVDAEKACRTLCMELVSLDTPGETDFIASIIQSADIYGLWTSGRLCNYPGCEKEPKFQPINVNGWVWATKGVQIGGDPGGQWSKTGAVGKPQPDNFLGSQGGENEECVAMLSNWYGDGPNGFHDMPCSERLPFICQKS